MSILDKLKKNSTIKETASLTRSKIYGQADFIPTPVPMINVALSGKLDGGMTPGLTVLAGPSKHFKSAFALVLAKSFLSKYAEGAILFYDSEFGTPESYFDSIGLDKERIIHTPITDIEELKHDIVNQLKNLEKGEHVLILIDSIGNLASRKEVDDALEGKSVADMTRAKQIKSLFRMVTPHLTIKDIPMVAVAHTYDTQEMFSKKVVSGGTGITYSANNIWIIGRQQSKNSKELVGYNFMINVEKSRYVREKSIIPINVSFEGGINRWSGLMENALEGKFLGKPAMGWYQLIDPKTSEFVGAKMREADVLSNDALWNDLLKNEDFCNFIETKYSLENARLISGDTVEEGSDENE